MSGEYRLGLLDLPFAKYKSPRAHRLRAVDRNHDLSHAFRCDSLPRPDMAAIRAHPDIVGSGRLGPPYEFALIQFVSMPGFQIPYSTSRELASHFRHIIRLFDDGLPIARLL